ncbi:hypothetical protein TNCV_137221 [Trichonephila clavipes]|nr:hypothetical protein TNCV_137221 [Trichonephila clavipes]
MTWMEDLDESAICCTAADKLGYPEIFSRGGIFLFWCCGSPEFKVSDHDRHVMSSRPVPLKTRHVSKRCMLNLSRAEPSSI